MCYLSLNFLYSIEEFQVVIYYIEVLCNSTKIDMKIRIEKDNTNIWESVFYLSDPKTQSLHVALNYLNEYAGFCKAFL